MTHPLDAAQLGALLHAVAAALDGERDRLNALDAALGDGDHGTAITTAFAEAARQIDGLTDPLPADVLKTAALALMNRMGGASGAIYGTLFLRASTAVAGKTTLTTAEWAALWRAGLVGVMQRGGAAPGDKTLVDALSPAVEALEAAAAAGDDLPAAASQAALAAAAGAERTTALVAKFGRAKFVGERAIGHPDAGAVSTAIMFAAIATFLNAMREPSDGA